LLVLDVADAERAREFARSLVLDEGRREALRGGHVQADAWFSDDRMTAA